MPSLTNAYLWVDPDRCTGCQRCVLACAMQHHQTCNPRLARIRIHRFENPDLNVPIACMACEDAPCIKVCPVNARLREVNGSVVTDENRCIGCRACLYICPNASPRVNPYSGQTMTCDLCLGRQDGPWCVIACRVEGALTVGDGQKHRQATARRQAGSRHAAGRKRIGWPRLDRQT